MEDVAQLYCQSNLSDYGPLSSARDGSSWVTRMQVAMQRLTKFFDNKYCACWDVELRIPSPKLGKRVLDRWIRIMISFNRLTPEKHRRLYDELCHRTFEVWKPRPFVVVTTATGPEIIMEPMQRVPELTKESDFSEFDDLLRFGGYFDGRLYTLRYTKKRFTWDYVPEAGNNIKIPNVSDTNAAHRELCILDERGRMIIYGKYGRSIVARHKVAVTPHVRFLSLKVFAHWVLVYCYLDAGGPRGLLVMERLQVGHLKERGMITCPNDQITAYSVVPSYRNGFEYKKDPQ